MTEEEALQLRKGNQELREAPVDLQEQVMGQGCIGVRLTSLIATLRVVMRLPNRQIHLYVRSLHGVTISNGEIVELHHRLKNRCNLFWMG